MLHNPHALNTLRLSPRNLYQRRPEITSSSQTNIKASNLSPLHYTDATDSSPRIGGPSYVRTPRPSDISDLAAYLARRGAEVV